MTEKVKYRVGAYVKQETWEKITKIQNEERSRTGRKPSQGEILDRILEQYKEK